MSKRGHIPLRTCIACRKVRPRDELLRFARRRDGISVDPEARLEGRGAYICFRRRCLETAIRKRSFERTLGRGLSPEEVEAMTSLLEN